MAKPLSPKSALIRDAIAANPDKTPKAIAELLNGSSERKTDKINVTANDVSQQKQAMKKPGATKGAGAAAPAPKGGNGRKKPGRKPAVAAPLAASANPVDLIDRTLALAQDCGGVDQLKRLVDRLAGVQR